MSIAKRLIPLPPTGVDMQACNIFVPSFVFTVREKRKSLFINHVSETASPYFHNNFIVNVVGEGALCVLWNLQEGEG